MRSEILVIDDSPDILSLTSKVLPEENYRVRVATTGKEGIASCGRRQPDLILLDLRLFDESGYDVCATLKEDPKTKEIPIIFLSASDEPLDKAKSLALGAVDFITKPFHSMELLARISTHLTLHRLQNQMKTLNEELEHRVAQKTEELTRIYKASQALSEEILYYPLLCNIVKSASAGFPY